MNLPTGSAGTSAEKRTIVITGGGTGGHVFPAIAIAEELRRRGYDILYVGSQTGMEAKLVPERGIPIHFVRAGSVKNQGALKIVKSVFQVMLATLGAMQLLRRHKVAAVVGVGGYVSVPASLAAFLLRIPLYLQEQNASVGIANRFLGRLARTIFLGFPEAESSFARSKCVVTGNPIRPEFYEPPPPAVDPARRHILIMGGSQGARAINELIVGLLELLPPTFPGITIVHQTGVTDCEVVRDAYGKKFSGQFEVVPFIKDVVSEYAKASLVVCRAGALTVSEVIQMGRPAIFIPYPRKGQNDQTANAYLLQQAGAARVVEQGDRFKERFWSALLEVFKTENLQQMAASYSQLRRPPALATIGDRIHRDLSTKA